MVITPILPATAEKLLALMHGICKGDGLTAVVSLHQVDFARKFADRIIGLASGQVLFDGTPDQLTSDIVERLYHTPHTAPQAGSLGAVPPQFQTEGLLT